MKFCLNIFILFILNLHLSAQKTVSDTITSTETLIELAKKTYKTNKNLAATLANKALKLARFKKNKTLEGKALQYICNLSFEISEYEDSYKYAQELLKFGELNNNANYISDGYKMIGRYFHFRGEYSQALQNYLEALKGFENTKDSIQISDSYNSIGGVYLNQGENQKAYTNYYNGMVIHMKLINFNGIGRGYLNLANVLIAEKDFIKGKLYLDSSLFFYKKANFIDGTALVFATYSEIFIENKQSDSALKYLLLAHNILKDLRRSYTITQTGLSVAKLYFARKEIKNALKYVNEAIDVGLSTRQNHNLTELYLLKSKIHESEGKIDEAFKNFKLYKLFSDSVINSVAIKKQAEDALQYEFDKKETAKEIEKQKTLTVQKEKESRQKLILNATILGMVLLVVILFLVARSFIINKKNNLIISKQKEEVVKQHVLLKEKNKEVMDSINYAKRLQNAIMPSENTIKTHFKNSFVLYKPKDIVAGDFYWMHTVTSLEMGVQSNSILETTNSEQRTTNSELILIAAADCTGHGVPGAMVSVVCSNALNRTVKEFGITEPNKILDKTRELVIETFEKSDKDVKDGMDISLCAINSSTNEVFWSGANNPLWIVRTNENRVEEITANKQAIGKSDNLKPYTNHKINLNKNDILILLTDGYADQFGGIKGKKFKYKQLSEILISISTFPMEKQSEILSKNFEDWKGQLEQVDDVCLIGIKF